MEKQMKRRKLMIVEPLENRLLMAVIAVLNNGDSGADSLRAAITAASNGDTIDLTGRSGTITLLTPITVDKNLAIEGPGATTLAIDGNHGTRLFDVTAGTTVSMADLTLSFTGRNS